MNKETGEETITTLVINQNIFLDRVGPSVQIEKGGRSFTSYHLL